MWCPACRQDVPAIAIAGEHGLCCIRCRKPIAATGGQTQTEAAPSNFESASRTSAVDHDELNLLAAQQAELDDILSRAEWLLGIETSTPSSRSKTYVTGVHGAHGAASGHHFTRHRDSDRATSASRITVLSWCALAIALTGFVCGGILLGWSLAFNRPELWNVGETVTLASQVGLLIGLILQLDRLGQDRHNTVNRLSVLDERVESLRSQNAFWSENRQLRTDAAEEVPEVTLADLKTQLDVLVTRLGDKRSA